MVICGISDLHGYLPEIKPCDILLISGDICPAYDHRIQFQLIWLDGNFKYWLKNQPCKHIVLVAGNHDFVFQEKAEAVRNLHLPCQYLENSTAVIDGVKIFGTPWSLWFRDWAFNAPEQNGEDFMADVFKKCETNTDIIVSHGPAFGFGDVTTDGINTGSKSLRSTIIRVGAKLVVCGHIHEGYGINRYGDAIVANCSVLNERYQMVNKPQYFDLTDGKITRIEEPV